MLKRFQEYINRNNLLEKQDKVLLAVSGGIDSMILLHLFSQSQYEYAVAHCNFQLRADDSDADEALVTEACKKLKVECFVSKFETTEFAKAQKLSIQESARKLRYDWFGELCEKHGFSKVATAHHASDQTETVIYNLTKGTGISGLRGIPLKNNLIIRPLLFAAKEELVAFAKEEGVLWRDDVSNESDKYSRNFIRHQIIPKLKSINPGLDVTMERNTAVFRDLESYIMDEVELIEKEYSDLTEGQINIALDWFEPGPKGRTILFFLLQKYGFNHDQISKLAECIGNESGKKFISSDYTLYLDRSQLILEQVSDYQREEILIDENQGSVDFDCKRFEFHRGDTTDFKLSANPDEAYLDADKISFPIKIRKWREGDAFFPLGMTRQKKLSDFMIDEKIPVNLKSRVSIFESDGNIVWIAGYRIDNRYKISDQTQRILFIKKTNV